MQPLESFLYDKKLQFSLLMKPNWRFYGFNTVIIIDLFTT